MLAATRCVKPCDRPDQSWIANERIEASAQPDREPRGACVRGHEDADRDADDAATTHTAMTPPNVRRGASSGMATSPLSRTIRAAGGTALRELAILHWGYTGVRRYAPRG